MGETFTSEGFVTASISFIGFVDKLGLEGLLTLKSDDGREFPIRAFSGEVARHILRFKEGDKSTIPTIYNLIEDISSLLDLLLMEVRIYRNGPVLRSNLYFKTRKEVITLRNYRASDSIALAAFFDVITSLRVLK